MATFAGYMRAEGEFAKVSLFSPERPTNIDMWSTAADGASQVSGLFDLNLPASRPPTETFDGVVQFSFYDDFYNRVWLIPNSLDFGPVTSDLSRSVVMWNANRTAVTLDVIDSGDDETVDVTGLTVGSTIKSLAARSFTIDVSAEGPSEIDATVTFTFTPTETALLPVAGVRSKVWAFMPNWQNPVEMQLEFMTEVIESRSGYEQRIANRDNPRMSISFTSVVNEFNYRQFIRQMASWQNKPTLMPDFSHGVKLAIAAENGVDTIVMDENQDWMAAGRTILIVRGGATRTEFLVRKVEEVIGNSLRLASVIDGDWDVGTKVYPTYTGYLGSKITASVPANRTAIVNVNFEADPGYELWNDVGDPAEDYLGRELFMLRPDWSDALSPEFEAALEVLDYGRGRKSYSIPRPFNTRIHKANYLGIGRAATDAIVAFFRRNKGAQGEFFMPTWTEDLRIKTLANSGTTGLRFAGPYVYQDYVDDVVYKDLIIFYIDGSHEVYHVDDIISVSDEDGDDSIINLTTPLLRNVDPANVMQVCWLPLWRFATDGLTVQWLTDETAQISLSMKSLRYVPAET
jgi:hypothetical protein